MAEETKITRSIKKEIPAKELVRSATAKKSANTEVKKEKKTLVDSKFTRPVFNLTGQEVGTVELPEEIFGAKVNEPLLLQALKVYQANTHQGTSSTKTRSEVRGGGRKPWKQKHTGRARAGSIRAPHWRGGGVVHGPKPRDVSLNLPSKMKLAALRSALASKLEDVVVIENFELKEPKTKLIANGIKKLNLTSKRLLLVLADLDPQVIRASRNISRLNSTKVQDLNAWQVIHSGKLVLAKDAINKLALKKEKKDDTN
jgi:large subunit ribosomal protein L4